MDKAWHIAVRFPTVGRGHCLLYPLAMMGIKIEIGFSVYGKQSQGRDSIYFNRYFVYHIHIISRGRMWEKTFTQSF